MVEIGDWVVRIGDELKGNNGPSISEKQQRKRPSIYKIPSRIIQHNKNAYEPQAVSFGPYHHGKDHLKAMEEHKHRALIHFLRRRNKPIELVVERMKQVVQELKDSYEPLDPDLAQDTRFLKMMILDGCFMLEILEPTNRDSDVYDENDPVFSEHGRLHVMPYIERDMLLLENQLPMLVLHTLIVVVSDKPQDDESLNTKILQFLGRPTDIAGTIGKREHALDVYRESLIWGGPSDPITMPPSNKAEDDEISRSVTELHEAGIRFEKSKTKSLQDVSFNCGVLRLPTIVVDDDTESKFLNLMAFERLHIGAGNQVTSYVYFMDTIIDEEMDVALLQRNGILIQALGCRKDVATLFNSLAKDITTDEEGVCEVVNMSVNLSNYCKKPWSRWRAGFCHTYFRNPWVAVSVIAAIFLFALTIIQTGYTIASYYDQHHNGGGGS